MKNENESAKKTVARRTRELRTRLGLTQDDLARRVGRHRSKVAHVEKGEGNLSVETIELFAKALSVDAVSLLINEEIAARVPAEEASLTRRVAKNLATLRKARGLSQDALSENAGAWRNYVSSVERLEINPTLNQLQKLADALDVPLASIFEPIDR
jgi:transcriptional regulator with XRE-family HTH domain